MTFDEMEQIERCEIRDAREQQRLLPVDSHSQLDTGYTGRSDCDVVDHVQRERERNRYHHRKATRTPKPTQANGHFKECPKRLAFEGTAAVECAHGFDACPECDPCTCPKKESTDAE